MMAARLVDSLYLAMGLLGIVSAAFVALGVYEFWQGAARRRYIAPAWLLHSLGFGSWAYSMRVMAATAELHFSTKPMTLVGGLFGLGALFLGTGLCLLFRAPRG